MIWFAIVALVLAVPPIFPYEYYAFLRVFICGVTAHYAYKCHKRGRGWELWRNTLIGVAVLFNPLIPVYLGKLLWSVADIALAIVLWKFWTAYRRGMT